MRKFWKGYRVAGATVVLIGAVVVASATPAAACSCASDDARTRLAQSDAAIIGVVVDEIDDKFVVDLLEVAKGPFNAGDQIVVDPGDPTSSCWSGPSNNGILVGFLYGDRGLWNYSYCGRATTGELREAVSPLPEPTPGEAQFLLAGQFGPGNNMVALARDGTIVGYGSGDTRIFDISICPGGRLFLTSSGAGQHEVRNSQDLSVVRDSALVFPGALLGGSVCLDASARSFVSLSYGNTQREIFVTDDSGTILLWSGDWYAIAVAPDREYVYVSPVAEPVIQLDLMDGSQRELPSDSRAIVTMAVSPDGRYLAGASSLEPLDGQIDVVLVIDIKQAAVVARLEPPPERWQEGTSIHWFDDGRLGVRPPGSLLDVYDQSFNLVARAERLPGSPAVNIDDTFVSFDELTVFETTVGRAADSPPLPVVVTTTAAPEITAPGPQSSSDGPPDRSVATQSAPDQQSQPADSDPDGDGSTIPLAALAGAAVASLLAAAAVAAILRLSRRGTAA